MVQEDGTENVCKIGISCKDVRIRLGALQNGNWRRLRVALSAIVPTEDIAEQLEQRVHFKIRHLRIISEWFRVDLATAQSMIAEAMLEMAVSNEPEQQELI